MSQALIRRDEGSSIALNEVMSLGEVFIKSGYFNDAKSQAQAVVKILYGQELGISPVQSMMSVHIINGKPGPSGGLVATLIKRSGRYNYRILEATNTVCRIEFFEQGQSLGPVEFTLEDAKKAGLLEGPTKANWSKYPADMLFNRCITRGARRHCADVFGGPVYTDEELQTSDLPANIVQIPRQQTVPASDDEPARLKPVPASLELTSEAESHAESAVAARCDQATASRLKALWAQAKPKGALADYVKRQGFTRLSEVPLAKAQKWISDLEQRLAVLAENEAPTPVNPGAPVGIAGNLKEHVEAAQAAWLSVSEMGVSDDEIKAELIGLMNLSEDESELLKLDSAQLLTVVQICKDWRAALEGSVNA